MNKISDQTIAEIRILSEIARANQSCLSVEEISELISTSLTEEELRESWQSTRILSECYELRNGLVLDRSNVGSSLGFSSQEMNEKKTRTREYVRYARNFLSCYRPGGVRLVSIGGSTSYYSPALGDDLDFFTISEQQTLWIFLFKSLLLARIYRVIHRDTPRICFSYAVDDSFAQRTFATEDPLLARDALSALVLYGADFYGRLLSVNPWMANYFPKLYRQKTEQVDHKTPSSKPPKFNTFRRFTNLFLFFFVGRYIRFKSALLNRNLQRNHRTTSLFSVRSGPDHCIFESVRYSTLRRLYAQLGTIILAKSIHTDGGTC